MPYQIERYHDICAGHRVVGHEGKCQHLHGHNYRITFTCEAEELDRVGRVIDFTEVKERLCMWLEDAWDHKFLAWEGDRLLRTVVRSTVKPAEGWDSLNADSLDMLNLSIVWVPFNPTAENIAKHLVDVIGPQQLAGTGIKLVRCVVQETRKCSASYSL